MDSLVADSQSWPTSLKKLYLKQLTASVSPLMLTMPSTLQVLSISNVASFSAQYFTDTFVPLGEGGTWVLSERVIRTEAFGDSPAGEQSFQFLDLKAN